MKKFSILVSCVFLFGSVSSTAFGGTVAIGVPPAKVKVVHPKSVQRAVVAPTHMPVPVAVAPVAPVKIVQPRVVQRRTVAAGSYESAVVTDPTRVAKVKTVLPKQVQRSVVAPTCAGGSPVDIGITRWANVKVVYPRTVQWSVPVPPAYGCSPCAVISP